MVQLGYTVRDVLAQHLANAILTVPTRQDLTRLITRDLLILDELGYLSMEPQVEPVHYELISERYKKGVTVITSNKSLANWGDLISDKLLAMPNDNELMTVSGVFQKFV